MVFSSLNLEETKNVIVLEGGPVMREEIEEDSTETGSQREQERQAK